WCGGEAYYRDAGTGSSAALATDDLSAGASSSRAGGTGRVCHTGPSAAGFCSGCVTRTSDRSSVADDAFCLALGGADHGGHRDQRMAGQGGFLCDSLSSSLSFKGFAASRRQSLLSERQEVPDQPGHFS